MKYMQKLETAFKDKPVFTLKELKMVFSKISRGYSKLLIHNLLKKKKIKRITAGKYTFKDDVEVVGFAFQPFYYGLQEALSLRNMWEQETNPIVITATKVRNGIRTFDGRNYLVKKISRNKFFGIEMIKYYDFWIPVSDIEKTLIDFAYFRQRIPVEAVKEMKKMIKKEVLEEYLKRYPKRVSVTVKRILKEVTT